MDGMKSPVFRQITDYITGHGLHYVIILALQLCMLVYWADVKSNFHEDEFYSIERAGDYTGRGDMATYITNSSDWESGEWMQVADLKKYIQVDHDEEMFDIPLTEAVKRMLTGRNYFGLLNIAESVAPGIKTSKWPGMILNMIFWLISQLLIFRLGQNLGLNKLYVALLMIMFGSCAYMIGLVTYIRFYIEVVMLILLMLLLHLRIWMTSNPGVIVGCLAGIGVSAFFSLANSELTLIYFGSFILCFWISLIIRHEWMKVGLYSLLPGCALVYLAVMTDWLDILLHMSEHQEGGRSRIGQYASAILDSVQNPSPGNALSVIAEMGRIINLYCFVYKYILIAWIVFLTVCVVYKLYCRRQTKYVESDLGMYSSENPSTRASDTFVLTMACSHIICDVFFILVGYVLWRYYCYCVIVFLVIFIYISDRLTPRIESHIKRRLFEIVPLVLTIIMVILPLVVRNIPCVYEESKVLIEAIENHSNLNAMIVDQVFDYGYNSTVAYDCVYLSGDDIDMYVIYPNASNYPPGYKDDFLLWCNAWVDDSITVNAIENRGYTIESLGADHHSRVYYCRYDN